MASTKKSTRKNYRIESTEEIIKAITEVLRTNTGEQIEEVAKCVGLEGITYVGDSMFKVEEA
jgi:hypothetical protein